MSFGPYKAWCKSIKQHTNVFAYDIGTCKENWFILKIEDISFIEFATEKKTVLYKEVHVSFIVIVTSLLQPKYRSTDIEIG